MTMPAAAQRGFGVTSRSDRWWIKPLLTFMGLFGFILYSTWAAFQGAHYSFGPYLSPFYSPEIFGDSPHSWFGPKPGWWPGALPWSPAFLILWAPAGFRMTCYYYRGAYYKAFWADPLSCTVGESRKGYRGEKSFPLVMQNVHRYFLYLALLFIPLLAWDVWEALWFTDATSGAKTFGFGVGTLVLALNVVLLGVALRGIGGGIIWVFSTQMLLQMLPNRVRGRVFSTEFALFSLMSAIGAALTGVALDAGLTIGQLVSGLAVATVLPTVGWSWWLMKKSID